MIQLVCILLFSITNYTNPDSIEGVWINQRTKAEIQFSKQGNVYNGLLIDTGSLEDNALIEGKTIYIFKDFKFHKNQYCCGTIFLPRKKIKAEGTIKMISEDKIEVSGSYGFYSQNDILYRKK